MAIVPIGRIWDATRPMVLAVLCFAWGWLAFHEQTDYLAEMRANRALSTALRATDQLLSCEEGRKRALV